MRTCIVQFQYLLLVFTYTHVCGCTQWVIWCQGSIWIITCLPWWPLSPQATVLSLFILIVQNAIFSLIMRKVKLNIYLPAEGSGFHWHQLTWHVTLFWLRSHICEHKEYVCVLRISTDVNTTQEFLNNALLWVRLCNIMQKLWIWLCSDITCMMNFVYVCVCKLCMIRENTVWHNALCWYHLRSFCQSAIAAHPLALCTPLLSSTLCIVGKVLPYFESQRSPYFVKLCHISRRNTDAHTQSLFKLSVTFLPE